MGDREGAGQRVLRRSWRARPATHHLRGRRREAVDLLLPGRGATRVRSDAHPLRNCSISAPASDFVATEFKHSFRSGRTCLARSTPCFARRRRLHRAHRRLRSRRCTRRCRRQRQAWSKSGTWRSPTIEQKEGWAAPFDVQTLTSGMAKLRRRIAAHRRGLAAPGPARQGCADPGAAARRAVRGDYPRVEEREDPGCRRRPAGCSPSISR